MSYLGRDGKVAIAKWNWRQRRSVASKVGFLSELYGFRGSPEWKKQVWLWKRYHELWLLRIWASLAFASADRYTAEQLDVISTVTLKVALASNWFRLRLVKRAMHLANVGLSRYVQEALKPGFVAEKHIHTWCLLRNTLSHGYCLLWWSERSREHHYEAVRYADQVVDLNQRSRVYRGLALQAARFRCEANAHRYLRLMHEAAEEAEAASVVWTDLVDKNTEARDEVNCLLNR